MAVLRSDEKEVNVEDGAQIREAAEQLGVLFGCEQGFCGTCKIEVEEGMENLSEVNDKEEEMGLPEGYRLACQCKIKQGLVKIKF